METEPFEQQAIVLFYQYFSTGLSQAFERWWEDPKTNVRKLYQWHENTLSALSSSSPSNDNRKRKLPLVGRILIAPEGINGTLSGNRSDIESYVRKMKDYHDVVGTTNNSNNNFDLRIFRDVDYKLSYDSSSEPLFPDLKISIVKEIVSTSGLVDVHDVPVETGRHLTPEEFHKALEDNKEDIALIDVRNTFEHEIGYFVDPTTNSKAIDPQTTTFSSFEKFCEQNAESLKDKKVLMYCTGGIRCEKASVILKRKGVRDVNQLSGGIHRYLETYGNNGHFKGLNFTFDKRVAMKPNFAAENNVYSQQKSEIERDEHYQVVGKCVECNTPFDELCGSRVCTVCRDLVLICDTCQPFLREYHCKRHASWKKTYFSFLEIFPIEELESQKDALTVLRDDDPSIPKNVRRTLTRQIDKVKARIRGIRDGSVSVDTNAPRRCRSCQEPLGEAGCDGKCWGFWRKAEVEASNDGTTSVTEERAPTTMRGRRAKQKLEAEMEYLTRPSGGSAAY